MSVPQFNPFENPIVLPEPPKHGPHDSKYLPKPVQIKIPSAAPLYKQKPLPLLKQNRLRNSIFAAGIGIFCWQVANYSFRVSKRDDFTQDSQYSEVLSEIKREEIMIATKGMERR